MELEHLFQQTAMFLAIQFVVTATVAELGGLDLFRSFVRSAASAVATFGPMALLVYILVEVSKLA